ncbi:poly(U)-specific endoribonuclease [Chryseobacterium defluvii]|uniref:Poly(U)-specific endoribonuclease n=1 Tax=Chryseobacterium defluvii TaxID=160396 RepID=A0A840K9T1_9FLAO|nr:hypothetical protein [Chryseobacterium defluvii]MBB4804738.1 poly(U)-specific endoribonuclease [Chryseobacterium defluvii]
MNIYQTLWDKDENKFSVSRRLDNREFDNPDADILLDEQIRANGKPDTDLAKNPLFKSVNKEKLQTDINLKFIKLLNNYIVNFKDREEYLPEEITEINEFIEAIRPTKVWEEAIYYIESELKYSIKDKLQETLFNIWCNLYTNWYNNNRIDYCSGFEHVFVGEGKLEKNPIIDGYHNWIKFLLDEKTGRVNYQGYNYGINGGSDYDGPSQPNIITLKMMWDLFDLNGNKIATLFKSRGGFFVGTSPECDFAMGTIAYFEHLAGRLVDDKREVSINKGRYDLILRRNVNQDQTLGQAIRSFFPVYRGEDIVEFILKNRFDGFDRNLLVNLAGGVDAQFVGTLQEKGVTEIYFHDEDWKLSFENWKE